MSAQHQFEDVLTKRHLPSNIEFTAAVAYGDVDGDGDTDLVHGGDRTTLYLNDGTGIFSDASAQLPSGAAAALVLSDVDGDGDLDLVLGTSGTFPNYGQQNRLYINDGTGTFTDDTVARMPAPAETTRALAVGDVDGDGDLDLVYGNGASFSGGEQNRLYLNDGTGTFADATAGRMPVDSLMTETLALADLDGDGDLDLVVGNGDLAFPYGKQNQLYLNDGTGIFADVTAARMPERVDQTGGIAVGDVDADGDLDLVFGNGSAGTPGQQNRLYLNEGTGFFDDASGTHMPEDVDWTQAVALGDVDGDGDLDLVLGNIDENRLYLNDGTGAYTAASAVQLPPGFDNTQALALVDVEGDGDLDLAIGNAYQHDRLYVNDGTGAFLDTTAARLSPIDETTVAVAVGDLDGDGDLDVVCGNSSAETRIYVNDGRAVFADVTASQLPAEECSTLALGDVDGDGDLDLVLGRSAFFPPGAGQNRLLLNQGDGVFVDVTVSHMPADTDFTQAVAFSDVDGDGDLDLFVGNRDLSSGAQNRLYLNDGQGRYSDVTGTQLPVLADYTSAVSFGDVDGDGDQDIVVANGGFFAPSYQDRLYLNDGAGVFADATATHMPVELDVSEAMALGDIDGDGDLDAVFGDSIRGENRLYVNDGNGFFADVSDAQLPAATATDALAFGDVDEDGDLDLVVGTRGFNRLYLNDGSGTFAEAAIRMASDNESTKALALRDLDRDGDLDLVVGNWDWPNRVYMNRHRQLGTPFFPRRAQPFEIVIHAAPGYATAPHTGLPVLGFALSPVALPIAGLGNFFLDPTLLVGLPAVAISPATGAGSLQVAVPANPTLEGLVLYQQALVLNNNTGDARFTGYTEDAIR